MFSMGGASQFGGGGFLPQASQIEAERPSYVQKEANKSLRSITFGRILEAVRANGEQMADNLVIDGQDVAEVQTVCQIMDIQETNAYTQYKVDDSTGVLFIRHFKTGDESSGQDLRVHNYVEVFGNLRTIDSQVCIRSYSIRPIQDHNLITCHLFRTVHEHLVLTRGPLEKENNHRSFMQGGENAFRAMTPPGGGSMFGAGGQTMHGKPGSRLDQLSDELSRIFVDECGSMKADGLHFNEICGRLRGNWPPNEVQSLLQELLKDGKIYNLQADHYQWCI